MAICGAVLGAAFEVLRNRIKAVVVDSMFKLSLKRLESTLGSLAPAVSEIRQLSEQLDLSDVETKNLIEIMEKGRGLVRKCLKIRWWDYGRQIYYSRKLEEWDKEIVKLCQVNLLVSSTRNALRTLERQRVSTVPGPQDFTVGLDMPMEELKTLLLKEEEEMLCQEDKMKVVKDKRYNHHHHHSDHDISGISAGPMEPLLLVNSLSHNDYMSVRSSLSSSLLSLPKPQALPLSLSSLSLSSPLPKPQALPLLELGIRRGLEDRDRYRDRDSACSNSPSRSEFASCETRDMKKSMDYGDKSCRQKNPEKNGSESSREIPSTEMIPELHPPVSFGYTAFSSDTSSLHSPLGAAMPSPSTPASQPIAKSESVPAFSSDNSSLHSPLGAAMPSPSAPTPQPIAKSESVPMNSQWHKRKCIGSGASGCVYVATHRETGALCAMKEVVLSPDDPKSAECIMQLQQEIKFLSQLKHPNIVQYYGSEIVNDRFYIYLEYVHPGSIKNYVREHRKAITESVVRNFTHHILSGLAYLHSTKTIHRDIKGANLLVNSSGVVKLADFGLAKHLALQEAKHSSKGTARWMAPELAQRSAFSSPDVALAVDIWSVGCTIIEMFTGKLPWGDLEVPAVCFKLYKGMSPPIPEKLSPVGKEFLSLCLKINPAERPSAASLLEHPFVKNSEQLDGN